MHENENSTFDEIYKQNKNRIHYQLYKLGIHDPHNEYYTEGIHAMWNAYKKYEPNKGPMGTYFNYTIRYGLIDMLRKKTTQLNQQDKATQIQEAEIDNGNHYGTYKFPVVDKTDISIHDHTFWKFIQSRLTTNQWKWVESYIIQGLSQKEIAAQEGVSTEAVKSWAKETRRKLQAEEQRLQRM